MESEEELEIFPVTKHRPFCSRCERPAKTCLCPWISDKKLFTNTEIIVIQNPHEAKSSIGTVFLMKLILENLTVISRTRLKSPFDALFDPILDRITQSGVPFALLYPSTRSIPIDIWKAQTEHSKNRCLIVLDGTWDSVKRIAKSPQLRNIPRVSIDLGRPGKYMIRKEPRAECLSTVEAVAECLGVIENDRVVTEALMKPFQQMIAFQLEFIKKGTPKHRPQNAGYVQDLYNDQ